jgi:hypothetical protein
LPNRWLNLAILWELCLIMLVLYLPALSAAFGTYALPIRDWLIVLATGLGVAPVAEIAKWVIRRTVPLETVASRTGVNGSRQIPNSAANSASFRQSGSHAPETGQVFMRRAENGGSA